MARHWSRKDRYTQRYNSKSALGQWCNRDIYRLKDSSKTQIQAIEIGKTNSSQEYQWDKQQYRSYYLSSRDKHVL